MKFREHSATVKLDPQMAPMIDIVFQLLIFFMLSLKIVEPEGDFNINMPVVGPSRQESDQPILPDIKVRLVADPQGHLQMLYLGPNPLGAAEAAFQELNRRILLLVGRPGDALAKDMEVEIDADYNLHTQHLISAVSACTGRWNKDHTKIIRYVEKIKFAPPRRPAAAAGGG